MSRAVSYCNRPFWSFYIVFLLFILIFISTTLERAGASPLFDFGQNPENTSTESSTENSTINISINNSMNNTTINDSMDSWTDNSTEITSNTDVYVIKAVVYEIGILTDTDNTTSSESTERQESINISLYNTAQEDEFS